MKCGSAFVKGLAILMLAATASGQPADQPGTSGGASTIQIHVKRFSFSPPEITVTKRKPVTLIITSEDVTHGLTIPELHITLSISKGKPTEYTFTPDQAGDFQGRCNHFCGVGHGSMTFTVHVKDS